MLNLTTLKVALKLDPDSDLEDTYLQGLEAAAVDAVERLTDDYFGPTEAAVEYVLTGDGTSTLYLPASASLVASVSSRAHLGATATAILTGDADGWLLRPTPRRTHGRQLIRRGGSAWSRWTEYVVTATIGYEPGEEPPLVRACVVDTVDTWYNDRGAAAELPESVQKKLQPFMRLAV